MRNLLILLISPMVLLVLSSCTKSGEGDTGLLDLLRGEGPSSLLILSTSPIKNDVNIPRNSTISVTFSEGIQDTTIDSTTFQISPAVAGSFNVSGNTVIFTPKSDLDKKTTYTITLTTGIQSQLGTSLTEDYSFSFTMGKGEDTTLPTVVSTAPVDGAVGVAVNTPVKVTFSEPITAVREDIEADPPVNIKTISVSGKTLRITFVGDLDFGTKYTLSLNGGSGKIMDLAGNPLGPYHFSFTTRPEDDTVPPKVKSKSPGDGSTVSAADLYHESPEPGYYIIVDFDDAIDGSTVSGIKVEGESSGSIKISASVAGAKVLIRLSGPPTEDMYTVTLPSGITDDSGNHYAGGSFNFAVTTSDSTPPEVSNSEPGDGETGISVNTAIRIEFSEAIDPDKVNGTTFNVKKGSKPVSGTIDKSQASSGVIIFTPNSKLSMDTVYTVTLTNGITDTVGNHLADVNVITFRTTDDDTPPLIVDRFPASGKSLTAPAMIYGPPYPSMRLVVVKFDDSIDPETVTDSSFYLTGPGGAVTPFTRVVSGKSVYMGFLSIKPGLYTVTLTSDITDDAGNAFAGTSYSFTVIEE
jgi:methionine-rich copper-binding protein CopC